MFSGYPVPSPSSLPADTSFLQRAVSQGRESLLDPIPATAPTGGRNRSRSFESNSNSIVEVDSEGFDGDGEDSDESGPRPLPPTTTAVAATRPVVKSYPVTESTPLISPSLPPHLDVAGPTTARRELGILLGYTYSPSLLHPIPPLEADQMFRHRLPICSTHFLEYSLLLVNVVSVGHIGTIELAAASLASITANVVALSIIQGLCTALDTLLPQAWTSKPKDMSLYAGRTMVLLTVLLVPQFVIFWNAEALLLLLRQDERVAERAGLYLKVLSFGLPGYAGFEVVRRFLQSQGLMTAPVIVLVITAPLNVFLNWLLVWSPSLGMGFVGAPLASALTMNMMFLVSIVYTVYFASRAGWGGWTWEMFNDLGPNIRLGLAGTAMISSEWYAWEIVGLASSFLGPEALAAQSVLLTSASLFYQIQYALSIAGAVRLGHLLGGGQPALARVSSRVCLGISVVVAGLNSVILLLCRNVWGRMFSSEKNVIALVAEVMGLVALFQLTDGVSGAAGGLLRGAGKSPLGAAINLTSYYVVGLPLGITIAFVGPKLGLEGLWVGLSAALTLTAGISTFVIWRMDFEKEAERARMRMGLVQREEEW